MNAYQLYDAVYDSARSEWIPESRADQIEDVIQYASTHDLNVAHDVAAQIVQAHEELLKANDENGQLTNNRWHCVEKPLSEIEL